MLLFILFWLNYTIKATITNSGEDVIHNELGVEPQNFSDDSDQSVYDLYEINRTANEIISNNWCRVSLFLF